MASQGSNDDDLWTWLGDAEPHGAPGIVKYSRVSLRCPDEYTTRIFKVGDFVVTNGEEEDGPWFGQIVEMLHDSSKKPPKRVTLRWCYREEDLSDQASAKVPDKPIIENEIFITDHVEKSGSNAVTVIGGIVFLAKSEAELHHLETDEHSEMEGKDEICLCRTFVNIHKPVRARHLRDGELSYMIDYPTVDSNQFKKSPLVRRGASGVNQGSSRKRPLIGDEGGGKKAKYSE